MLHGLSNAGPCCLRPQTIFNQFCPSAIHLRYLHLEDIPRSQAHRQRRKLRASDRRDPSSGKSIVNALIRSAPKLVIGDYQSYPYLIYHSEKSKNKGSVTSQPSRLKRMKSYVEVVTNPTADTPGTCLLLHFDNKRYLLGHVHEGFQRALVEQKLSSTKVSDIFLTGQTRWDTTGGIIGMILTLAESVSASAGATLDRERQRQERMNENISVKAKEKLQKESKEVERASQQNIKPRLTLHGGGNILHTLATGRRFIFRQGLPIYVNEYDEVIPNDSNLSEPTWSDENIRVWAIPTHARTSDNGSDIPLPARKRSFKEYSESHSTVQSNGDAVSEQPTKEPISNEHRLSILRSVVSDMFDSDWRLDALFENKLKDVPMPAAIFVRNEETKKIERYKGPPPGDANSDPELPVLIRRPWPGALVADLPTSKPSQTSISYIVRNQPQRGRFIPKKAAELNVQPGPNFGLLAAGKSVLARDGTIVTPEQVLEKGKPGGGIFIADIPSTDHVQDLLAQPHWNSTDVMEGVGAVVWILGPDVYQDQRLQDFVRKRDNLQHIVSCQELSANRLSMDSAAAATIRHCEIDPVRYGIPKHNNKSPEMPEGFSKARIADRKLTIHLEPQFKVDDSSVKPPLNTAKVLQESSREVFELAKKAQNTVSSTLFQNEVANQELPNAETEVITLGTGSALPSKYRNVSSTLVRVPGVGSYLLDCGENTLGQLSRMYSKEELLDVLKDLRMIWISHLHADHHLGTTSVIKAWYQAVHGTSSLEQDDNVKQSPSSFFHHHSTSKRPLFVAAEPAMIGWLREYASVEDFGHDKLVTFAVRGAQRGDPTSTSLRWGGQNLSFHHSSEDIRQALQEGTGLSDLAAAPVPHCHNAMAVAMTFPSGLKISYSGDCRPSKDFVDIGQNTTLLIHEATFDDDMQGDAIAKKHSTISEAIGVGVAMNARRVILTHFSQRYQKIPSMDTLGKSTLKLESSSNQEDLPSSGTEGSKADPNSAIPNQKADEVSEVKVTPSSKKDLRVGIAFDYMRVKLKDIASLETFNPAFIKLYENAAQ